MAGIKDKDLLNQMREQLEFIDKNLTKEERERLKDEAECSEGTLRNYFGGHIPIKLVGQGLINLGMKIINERENEPNQNLQVTSS